MEVQLLNGGTNSLMPMNGTNTSVPMNGTNASVPMQGSNGIVYYVAPVSLMDIEQVPTDWIPTGLHPDDVLYLKTAYMMGDPEALNGKLGDALKKAAQKVGNAIPVAAKAVTNAVMSVVPGGKALVQASEANYQKFQKQAEDAIRATEQAIANKMVADELAKIPTATATSKRVETEAKKLAAETIQDLTKIGINPNPEIIADRALMAADAGVKSGGGGGLVDRIKNWWAGASTTEKVLAGAATAAVVYGGYKGVQYLMDDKRKKSRKK